MQEHLDSQALHPERELPSGNVTDQEATPGSPAAAGQMLSLQETPDTPDPPGDQPDPEAEQELVGSGQLGITGGPEQHPEAVEALRDIGKLRRKFGDLQARVEDLEEGKLDRSVLTQFTELITNRGATAPHFIREALIPSVPDSMFVHSEFQDSSDRLTDQLTQQKTLIENLSSDQKKVESIHPPRASHDSLFLFTPPTFPTPPQNSQLMNDVQTAFLQLRAECEKLQESNRSLQEESREKQSHVQVRSH